MKITRLEPPINGGTLFWGQATSTRGRRYDFGVTSDGIGYAFREEPSSMLPDGRCCWLQVKAPLALERAAREAIRKAVAS